MAHLYGGAVTASGRTLIISSLAGGVLELTRVMVGTGRPPEGASEKDLMDVTTLYEPIAEATSTFPVVDGDTVSFIVEYRSDLNGGLKKDFWMCEYGVFARDSSKTDAPEVLIFYATLGDYPQHVHAFKDGRIDIRRFPVSIAVQEGAEIHVSYPTTAFMTAQDMQNAISHAGSLGGAYQIDSLVISSKGWTSLAVAKGDYKYQYDLAVEESKESHYPEAALSIESLKTAEACGLCPTIQALNGKLRFWAKSQPKADMTGTYALFAHGKYAGMDNVGDGYTLPAASRDILGGVKVGDGLEVAGDGRLRVVGLSEESIASDESIRQMVEDSFKG